MRRTGRTALLLGAVWLMAGIPSGAPAQEGAALGGFDVNAWGSGVTWVYDQPGSPIPASPTAEMHGAYSLATLRTGGSGHAVGAEIWPGPVAATVAPFIEDSFWSGFNDGSKEFADGMNEAREEGLPIPEQEPQRFENPQLVPKQYPAGAEVFLPPGGEQSAPFAHARAVDLTVEADTDSVKLLFPGVLAARAVASDARSAIDTAQTDTGEEVPLAVARATSKTGQVSILGGLVEIDEVSTVATVTSDGETAEIAGRTVVTGLRIDGNEFSIDEGGIHAGGEDQENPVTGQFNENAAAVLEGSGVMLTLAQPVDTTHGNRASRSAGGLIVQVSAERMEEAFSGLPDEIENELRGQGVAFTQTTTIVLAAVNVSSGASEGFSFGDTDFGGFDDVGGASDFGGAAVLGGTTGGDGGQNEVTLQSTPAPVIRPTPEGRQAAPARFTPPIDVDGVGAGAVVLGMVLALAAARLLWKLSDTFATPVAAGAVCDDA